MIKFIHTILNQSAVTVRLALITCVLSTVFSNSTKSQINTNWRINPVNNKVFIENRGQFDADVNTNTAVLFFAKLGNVKLYFTANGVIYRYDKMPLLTLEPDDVTDPRELGNPTPEIHYSNKEWVGSSSNVTVTGQEEQSDYYTYEASENTTIKAFAYKKIIYQNLYPGIDVEYTFPENKEGIEYSLIVHAGADVSKVKMLFSGTRYVSLDKKNASLAVSMINKNVVDILEYAPQTYYQNSKEPISSTFSVTGNTVSFIVSAYDKSKDIVVDPWTINPGFTNLNRAFDIATDNSGNIYAFGGGGGGSAWLLKKFTSGGALVWTFTTTFASWYGDLAVDGAGNSYITEGCCGGGIRKISTGGAVVWAVNNGVYEYWLLQFDGTLTNLYLGCAYSSGAIPAESVSHLNTATGAITGAIALPSGGSEPRSIAWAKNGNLFFLTATGGNDVIGVTPAFATVFSVNNGYGLAYNGPTYADGSNSTSAQNGIAASRTTFIATSNGATLMKRSISTGALLGSLAIPGGVVEGNSGVIVDSCGHIYVGSQTAVYEYDSLLNPLANAPTTGAVYCLWYVGGGQILASGNGFISSLSFPVCGGPLPVKLNDFSCYNTGHGIALNWSTATESNNKYFTIERSGDGVNFTSIKLVTGAGNSITPKYYEYVDNEPLAGNNYYRLSQTDFDGKTIYFNVTECNETSNNLMIYPNASTGIFYVMLPTEISTEKVSVSVLNMLGQEVYNGAFENMQKLSIDLSGQPSAVYMLKITGGGKAYTDKLMICR